MAGAILLKLPCVCRLPAALQEEEEEAHDANEVLSTCAAISFLCNLGLWQEDWDESPQTSKDDEKDRHMRERIRLRDL